MNCNQWSTMYNTTWNIYAIFMGECLFDANRITSTALKLLISLCMLYFFIMCTAYGGILIGFLTSPILSKAIETPQDVCIYFHNSICFKNFSFQPCAWPFLLDEGPSHQAGRFNLNQQPIILSWKLEGIKWSLSSSLFTVYSWRASIWYPFSFVGWSDFSWAQPQAPV